MIINREKIWDFWAPRYERLWSQYFALGPSRACIHEHLASLGVQPQYILDIGCGVGQLVCELAQKWPQAAVVGIDTSEGMIKRANHDYWLPNTTYHHSNLLDLRMKNHFDIIVSTNSFPYFPNKKKTLTFLHTLLKPGGRICIVQANRQNNYDGLWLLFVKFTVSKSQYLSKEKIQSLLRTTGFKQGKITPVTRHFFIPSMYLVEGIKPMI